jgi:hypothetical protein
MLSHEAGQLPTAYLGLAVAALVWWNGSNPEVTVAETNLTGRRHGQAGCGLRVTMTTTPCALIGSIGAPDTQAGLRSRLFTPPDRWNAPAVHTSQSTERHRAGPLRMGGLQHTSRHAAVESCQGLLAKPTRPSGRGAGRQGE